MRRLLEAVGDFAIIALAVAVGTFVALCLAQAVLG